MNTDLIDSVTDNLISNGHRVFQIHRFAESDRAHVLRLAQWADFKQSSKIIDLGCGVGEVSKIMKEVRSDLNFTLVNISSVQLGYADEGFVKHCCNFCKVPEKDESFDGAMFLFSIGHSDIARALQEAYRILKEGGILFIYDMARTHGDNKNMESVSYQVNSKENMINAAEACGFKLDFYLEPSDRGGYGKSLFGDDFNIVFDGTIPAIWRLIK